MKKYLVMLLALAFCSVGVQAGVLHEKFDLNVSGGLVLPGTLKLDSDDGNKDYFDSGLGFDVTIEPTYKVTKKFTLGVGYTLKTPVELDVADYYDDIKDAIAPFHRLYAVANYYFVPECSRFSFYFTGQLGVSIFTEQIMKSIDSNYLTSTLENGVHYAIGIGADYKQYFTELLLSSDSGVQKLSPTASFISKFGNVNIGAPTDYKYSSLSLSVGYRF